MVEIKNAFLVSLTPLLSEMSMQSFVFLMPLMTVNNNSILKNRTKTPRYRLVFEVKPSLQPPCLDLNVTDLFQLRLRREATWKFMVSSTFNTDRPRNYSRTTFQVDGQRVSGAVLDDD